MQKVRFTAEILTEELAGKLLQFVNCRVLRNGRIQSGYVWVRDGRILDAARIFFEEQRLADIQIDCENKILSPGFIDIQINGGFGFDFSSVDCTQDEFKEGLEMVSKRLLADGVTSYAPTVITSSPDVYHKVLPLLTRRPASVADGAGILGAHLEGPFISAEKRGCHPKQFVRSFDDDPIKAIDEVYGSTENIALITLAPELEHAKEAIVYLNERGVTVSVGHSSANLQDGEEAFAFGAKTITHLFNAMQSYHHRDPGLIGLLTSVNIPEERQVTFGIISDGIHTHDSALRVAYTASPKGLILVTDAIAALGMGDGTHRLGAQTIQVSGLSAILDGTTTTAGSVASMPLCIRHFVRAARCSLAEALLCATEKPAKLMGIDGERGTLNVGSVADLVVVDDDVHVLATFCQGRRAFAATAED